jgi:hypothetical protein
MSGQRSEVAAAIAAVKSGERYEMEPSSEDERVGFLNISQTEVEGFEIEVKISVSKTVVPSDLVPVTAIDDPEEATALVDVLGREGVFAELVDAVSSVYECPEETVTEQFERDLHCTRAWSDEPSVSNALFQTRFAADTDGIRSGRLHADDLWY